MSVKPFMSVKDFMESEIEDSESWLGDGLFGPQMRMLIAGRGGSKKSFFVKGLATALVSDNTVEYVGFRCACKKRVAYLNFEISEPELKKRMDPIYERLNVEEMERFFVMSSFDFKIESDYAVLMDQCIEHRPDIVIFDCLYKMHSRDEDKASEMKPILDVLEMFVHHGMSVVLLHHHNKSNDERGSSCITDWVDTSIGIKNNTLYFNKTRNGPTPNNVKLDWNDDQLNFSFAGPVPVPNTQKITNNIILNIIDSHGLHGMIGRSELGAILESRGICKADSLRKFKCSGDLREKRINGKMYYNSISRSEA